MPDAFLGEFIVIQLVIIEFPISINQALCSNPKTKFEIGLVLKMGLPRIPCSKY